MNIPLVSFECTALQGTNKQGIVKCSADGYYPVVLGALNSFNSAGAYYPADESARQLFEASSLLMRRINSGTLHGECGHPRRDPRGTDRDFVIRLYDIYEPNVSHHIRKVWLSEEGRGGQKLILVMGEVRPAGPRGAALKEALENRHQNVCFSVRSFTLDSPFNGTIYKSLREIVTWDWVNEPGIASADKWHIPTLESFDDSKASISKEMLLSMAIEERARGVTLESKPNTVQQLVQTLGWGPKTKKEQPATARW